jgi:nucleotide-binding universal stress UspA family protein
VSELLVPVGFSPIWNRGAGVAVRYAQRWNLPLRLLHVRTSDEPSDAPHVPTEAHRLATSFQISASGEEVAGDEIAPAVAAAAGEGSLIVLASDHVGQLTTPGSVGESIVRAADQPVILCGPHCVDPPATGRVMVALDGSEWAEAAIGPAVAVASASGATIWLVHVAPKSSVAHAAELRQQGRPVSLSRNVRELADRLEADGVKVGWELVQGDVVGGLLQFARRREVELIVATTHGESGLARQVLGSVAMGVVRSSTTPVLIVPTETRHASELP